MRLDSSGAVVWRRSYANTDGVAASVAKVVSMSDAGFMIVATKYQSQDTAHIWLLRMDGAGNLLNEYTLGTGQEGAVDGLRSRAGELVILAATLGAMDQLHVSKITSDGQPYWWKSFAAHVAGAGLAETPGGEIYVATSVDSDTRSLEMLVAKLSASGETMWSYSFGRAGSDIVGGVAVTDDGGCIIVGRTESWDVGIFDSYYARLAPGGSLRWEKTFGAWYWDTIDAIIPAQGGGFIVTGGGNPVVVARISSDLTP
jgi:hypothetical protein